MTGIQDIIYEGKLNDIGDSGLGYAWYDERNKPINKILPRIKKNTQNYFRNIIKGKASENMWTCFKNTQPLLKGDGYARGFVQCSARATNAFRHKKNLAYLVNRFTHQGLVQYFASRNVKVDQNLFAVSEMIQWVCVHRSGMGSR